MMALLDARYYLELIAATLAEFHLGICPSEILTTTVSNVFSRAAAAHHKKHATNVTEDQLRDAYNRLQEICHMGELVFQNMGCINTDILLLQEAKLSLHDTHNHTSIGVTTPLNSHPAYTIAVCSTTPLKHDAVRAAFASVFPQFTLHLVTPTLVKSGVSSQPYGNTEICHGMMNRLMRACAEFPHAHYVVSIESGLVCVNDRHYDVAGIAIYSSTTTIVKSTVSHGVEIPEDIINEWLPLRANGTTIGDVITKKWGGDPHDPHTTLTDGISRKTLLEDVIKFVLLQC
jgi:non-canonical (house-cleaning) NTP pyrophosphatase